MERDTKSTPLVTIAIPIYNAEKYLRYAIQSCINQTYQNWELLLMCDGSTDKSDEIATDLSLQDSRIVLINDHKNLGLPARLNETINMARGEFYVRMDADDIMAVDRVETQVSYLMKHPEVDVVGSSAMIIDAKNNIIRTSSQGGITSDFIHPSVCGRTEWFRRNKYDEKCRRCQDKELWLRTANRSKFYNIERPLLFYRELGIPTLNKYRKSQQSLRHIFKGYKKYGKSLSWYMHSMFVSYIKELAYLFFASIGKLDYLIEKRQRVQLPEDLWLSSKDLDSSIKKNNIVSMKPFSTD
ncbi:MAG: glycosyltransferase family 2 protein [Prevotella sp.]|nr:glycosyltransferase family 2 protein [Prevotella sp.]